MSTRIGKLMLVTAIGVCGAAMGVYAALFLVDYDPGWMFNAVKALAVVYLPLSGGAAYFYLMKERPLIAARAWGILGGGTTCFAGVLLNPPGILALLLAIGGALLALARPKLAGILMLASAIMSWIAAAFVIAIFVMFAVGVDLPSAFEKITPLILKFMMPYLVASFFLIPGGILALTQKERPASIKMVLGVIGALFAFTFLWVLLLAAPI